MSPDACGMRIAGIVTISPRAELAQDLRSSKLGNHAAALAGTFRFFFGSPPGDIIAALKGANCTRSEGLRIASLREQLNAFEAPRRVLRADLKVWVGGLTDGLRLGSLEAMESIIARSLEWRLVSRCY